MSTCVFARLRLAFRLLLHSRTLRSCHWLACSRFVASSQSAPCCWLHAAASVVFLMAAMHRPAVAVELIQLSPANYDAIVPRGKEVDAIYGDWVLRNEHVVAVIAQQRPGRHANMGVRGISGMLIDLTARSSQSDQLSCFYPGGGRYNFEDPSGSTVKLDGRDWPLASRERFEAREMVLTVTGQANTSQANPVAASSVRVSYILRDRQPWLEYQVEVTNRSEQPLKVVAQDSIRCDGTTFQFSTDPDLRLTWLDESFFHQCYGVVPDAGVLERGADKRALVHQDGADDMLAAGASRVWGGKLLAAHGLPGVRSLAAAVQSGQPVQSYQLKLQGADGVAGYARVEFFDGKQSLGGTLTNAEGILRLPLSAGRYALQIDAVGREPRRHEFEIGRVPQAETLTLTEASRIRFSVTDESGKLIAAKVQIRGEGGTPDPNFGPDSGDFGVRNLVYLAKGTATRALAAGRYKLLISHGPEFDAVSRSVEVEPGKQTPVAVSLARPVNTQGWVSAEFHSHSSPSGDNTASQLGRVLNLLAEQLEFAPCTEHNRIDSYDEELMLLGATQDLATCTGMELTGSPLPLNHQNAFPLHHHPHTQDGGGPQTDADPVVQIERLSLWDSGSAKLVQSNHPNIPQMLGDRDLDGMPDEGFRGMFGFMDVIEVHPPQGIFTPPPADQAPKDRVSNPIFHWMQLLNLGYRIPGVVNTDAHYNWHGSGWLRNYLASSTDNPSEIDIHEMVHAAEHGHIIMTTAPFLEVQVRTEVNGQPVRYISGEDVPLGDGTARLWVRVQCANWYDINRVQVFANGRPVPELNFTRRTHPRLFSNRSVRFEHELELPSLAEDTHFIVATIGEGLTLGEVMGSDRGQLPPVAVSNPIFVDIDGGGFQPNQDDLGVPFMLPQAEPQPATGTSAATSDGSATPDRAATRDGSATPAKP
jgi:hypothetical protein